MLARARAFARSLPDRQAGVAAIEFAFIVPIMFVMFVGAVELSQAITVDRRVTQAASSVADLIARKETSIAQSEIGDIMKIGGYILAPYSQTPLQVDRTQRQLLVRPTRPTPSSPGSARTRVSGAHTGLRVHELDLYHAPPAW